MDREIGRNKRKRDIKLDKKEKEGERGREVEKER